MKTILYVIILISVSILDFVAFGAEDEERFAYEAMDGSFQMSFSARFPETPKRTPNDSGYAVYAGKLYRTNFTVPTSILLEGKVTIKGNKDAVQLDVRGIADILMHGQKILESHVNLEVLEQGPSPIYRLSVYFSKGGSEDRTVVWILSGEHSLLDSITFSDDTVPDWVKKKMKKMKQKEGNRK